jgi:hypothetical protein
MAGFWPRGEKRRMRIFRIALPALFVAGLALFATRAWSDAADAAAQKLAQEHARSRFVQRAAIARAAADLEGYRADLGTLLRDWFAEETEIANRFPLQKRAGAPFLPPPPKGNVEEWQELAESQVAAWREGKLELLQTAQSQGLRLDLLRVSPVAAPQPHLAVDLAIWGAPENLEEQRAGEPLVFQGLAARFLDASGRTTARLDGAGEPALRLDLPERLVADAPPGLVLGRYEVPLFPPGAAQVEWSLSVQVRSPSGEARVANATWRSAADPAWAGGAWSAADHVVAEHAAAGKAQTVPAVAKGNAKIAVWPERE